MGGMYNMMVPNAMIGGNYPASMQTSGMDMMSPTGLDIMSTTGMDISSMGAQPLAAQGTTMEMGMMGGVVMDPSMMGMYPNMNADAMLEKKEIDLKYCKLYPSVPGTQQAPQRTKPPGCRTIFVGGLPDKIRESTVREIFERYGHIQILRLSKKNFCHIRFDREASVDAAMTISGYKIRLKEKDKDAVDEDDDSHANNGYLLVDYAMVRYKTRYFVSLRMLSHS